MPSKADVNPPTNITVQCPDIPMIDKKLSFGELFERYIALIKEYNKCADDHNDLIDYLRNK